jgi:hypothetical protein
MEEKILKNSKHFLRLKSEKYLMNLMKLGWQYRNNTLVLEKLRGITS